MGGGNGTEGATLRLAGFLSRLRAEEIPPPAYGRARIHLLDFLACALAGLRHPLAGAVLGHVRHQGGAPQATALGLEEKTTAPQAALVNGALGHAVDFDDTSWTMIGHATTAVLPAALAEAEHLGRSGREALAAFIAGIEVCSRIGAATTPRISYRGFHTTGVLGALGAAAAAAWLRRGDEHRMAMTLGAAASMASGLLGNLGSLSKPFHPGWAASSGVHAAQLVERGLTANVDIFERKNGFFQAFDGESEAAAALERLGAPLHILEPGMAIKPYPSCTSCHPAVEAMLELVLGHDLQPGDVERIEVGVNPFGFFELRYDDPQDANQARFSMPFAMAVALMKRKAGLAEYAEENVRDAGMRDVMKRVRMSVLPEFADGGIDPKSPAVVTVHLRDGRRLEKRVDMARGNPERPLGREELREKLEQCAEGVLPRESVGEVLESAESFEAAPRAGALLERLSSSVKTVRLA